MSDIDREDDIERQAFEHIAGVIDEWVKMGQLQGTSPLVAAAKLFECLSDVLLVAMGRSAVRMALLMVFEKSYPEGMSLPDRAEAARWLDQVVQARRKVEGKGSLILPGKADG